MFRLQWQLLVTLFSLLVPSIVEGAVAEPTSGAQPTGSDPGTSGQPSGQQPTGQQPTQGTQQQPADGLRQLRESYETLKKDFEPWQKLNVKPEQVTQYSGVYQKVYGAASQLGKQLGYPDDEIAEALAEDPVRTLDFLRSQAQQGQQNQGGEQDLAELVQQHVEQALSPIQQRENVRATNEANALFERTVHQSAVESFKAEGIDVAQIPEDEMFMLTSATSEILKYDEAALRALKYEGKTAAIQKAFQEARTLLDKYYLARSGRDRNRVNPQPNNGQQNNQQVNKKPSLDDILNDPSTIDVAQGRTGANAKYLR